MLAIQLSDEIEQRLEAAAKATGRGKESTALAAIVEYLDDLEDLAIAKRRLEDIRAGRSETVDLAEVGRDLGLAH